VFHPVVGGGLRGGRKPRGATGLVVGVTPYREATDFREEEGPGAGGGGTRSNGRRAEVSERGHGFSGGESFEGRNPMSVLAPRGARRGKVP
jgi:hypothetical protein